MPDRITRATAADHTVSIVFCEMRECCEEAIKIHNLKGKAAEALCRGLIGGALLGSTLKNEGDNVTMIIRGDGPAGGLTIKADVNGGVRGYLYHPDAQANTVSDAIGAGVLTVIKDLALSQSYSGQLPLISGEIAEDITAYFAESEQIPSSCGMGVVLNEDGTVKVAGGFLIQLLPDAPYSVVDQLELDLTRHPSPSRLLEEYGDDVEKILVKMLPGLNVRILNEYPISWECTCSRDRMARALISIGKEQLRELLQDGDDTEVTCDFCKSSYTFTPEEIRQLYHEAL